MSESKISKGPGSPMDAGKPPQKNLRLWESYFKRTWDAGKGPGLPRCFTVASLVAQWGQVRPSSFVGGFKASPGGPGPFEVASQHFLGDPDPFEVASKHLLAAQVLLMWCTWSYCAANEATLKELGRLRQPWRDSILAQWPKI